MVGTEVQSFHVGVIWSVRLRVKQGAGEDEYTVYVHARPGFAYTQNNTKCSAFIDRQLKEPVLVIIIYEHMDAGLVDQPALDTA